MENHHIIIGWNKCSKQLIQKIRDNGKKEGIILIDDSLKFIPDELPKDVSFIKGNAYNPDVLVKADIKHAKIVMITSDPAKREEEADHQSIMFTVAAKAANPNVRVITEILTRKQAENAKRVGASTIIQSSELLGGLMYNTLNYHSAQKNKI
ncbi:voltage-gated potassium channel [Thalassobacillus cyri]|uniref:Voltage-gated potassium channel n=1 Tax=Thalassobacillus cyri TaxID=571932 RepID=A0A1H4G8M5_9BACI|nr:NAD(P)-binding protein [Thalassobacillus cyri]SEB05797.1 voltage-gated potassium channel [Thalassobacillus cyri]